MNPLAARHAGCGRAWRLPACGALLACAVWSGSAALAATTTSSGTLPLAASADLRFAISIDKFLFFRIGDGHWPNPGGTPSVIEFTVAPNVPAAPVAGNQIPFDWSGAVPVVGVTATNNVLPVEVRSNAGAVSLRASVTLPLSNGAQTIPMTALLITSSDSSLPAPSVPATGMGPPVNVAGGGSGTVSSLVTQRSANWTFSLLNSASYAAGVYNGRLTFTASAP